MLDLVVRGGTVVAPWGVGPWDVAVKDGRIVSVSEPGSLTNDAVRVVDAKGKIVVPGGRRAPCSLLLDRAYVGSRRCQHRQHRGRQPSLFVRRHHYAG